MLVFKKEIYELEREKNYYRTFKVYKRSVPPSQKPKLINDIWGVPAAPLTCLPHPPSLPPTTQPHRNKSTALIKILSYHVICTFMYTCKLRGEITWCCISIRIKKSFYNSWYIFICTSSQTKEIYGWSQTLISG